MNYKTFLLVAFWSWLNSFFGLEARSQTHLQPIDLQNNVWKFKTDDKIIYSAIALDDSTWETIAVKTSWEAAKNFEFDGIAWYRTQVVIPKTWKKELRKTDTLTLKLGKIDDADETFFNGVLVGATGKFPPQNISAYDVDRAYLVPAKLINFDTTNTIAVRIADWGGGGGMYAGDYLIEPSTWANKTKLQLVCGTRSYNFLKDSTVTWSINIKNNSREAIAGALEITITTYTGKLVSFETKNVQILAHSELQLPNLNFGVLAPDFYHINVKLKDEFGVEASEKSGFAVAPDSLKNETHIPFDFLQFWQKTRAELDAVAPDFLVTPSKKYSTETVDVFDVEMRSYGNVRINGYYAQPKNKTHLPAILHVPGYSSVMTPSGLRDDVAQLFLNIRGHGNSKKDINPGFPGFLKKGLDSAKNYIYRGAYMDCVRAVDFLCSRAEIDTMRLAIMGASQGGALSFVTAALDKRIKLCAPDVPFLSNFRLYFQIAPWPSNEYRLYAASTFKPLDSVYNVLDYFDVSHFAPLIDCPVFMGVGLYDDVCPPAINFSAFNNLKSRDKTFQLFPKSGHGLPSEHYNERIHWIFKHWGV